jgi:DNA-binding response OmpR family regulator
LLVALVQHHTRALSKDEILALVWSGSVVEEGNLAQQVLLLRRALADAGYAGTPAEFSLQAGADRLAARFAACLAGR